MDDNPLAAFLLHVGDGDSLVVAEVMGRRRCDVHLDLGDVFHADRTLQDAHHDQRLGLVGLDQPHPVAVAAAVVEVVFEARTHALPGEFQQAERAHAEDLGLRAILLEPVADDPLDRPAILLGAHVHEVDHDHAAQVPQAQLAEDFLGRLFVEAGGAGFGVGMGAEPSGVDVDGHQCLGLVDHQRAATLELDAAGVDLLDLLLQAELVEETFLAGVLFDLMFGPRDGHLQEFLHPEAHLGAVADDAIHVGVVDIADGADHQVALAIELAGGLGLLGVLLDGLPQAKQVSQVALEVALGAVHPGGPHDESHIIGCLELGEDFFRAASGVIVLDLSRNAQLAHPGHHHQQPTRDGEVGRQRRALRADALLGHLDDDLLAALDALLDRRARAVRTLASDGFGLLRFFLSEVLRVQVGDVQEPVLGPAEVHERRLDGRLDIDDSAFVDVPDMRSAGGPLDVQFFQLPVGEDRDTAFLRLDGVDEHLFFHVVGPVSNRPRVSRRVGVRTRSAPGCGQPVRGLPAGRARGCRVSRPVWPNAAVAARASVSADRTRR